MRPNRFVHRFLRELLVVELELRSQFREALILQDYLNRFPIDELLVRSVFESTQVEPATTRASLPATQFIPNIQPAGDVNHSELTERDQMTKERGEEPPITEGSCKPTRRNPASSRAQERGGEFFSDDVLLRPLGRFVLLRLLGVGIFGQSIWRGTICWTAKSPSSFPTPV